VKDKLIADMNERELLVELATDMRWMKDKLHRLCTEVYVEHANRLRALEQSDAKQLGAENEKKDKTALAIAIMALIVSTIATLGGLIL